MPGEEDDYGPIVRPYALTNGRTQPTREYDLPLETLVSATSLGLSLAHRIGLEQRRIVMLCQGILSVAEIAARLQMTLGVARVLIGDMAQDGLVAVYQTENFDDRPDLMLLERVLHGLRKP